MKLKISKKNKVKKLKIGTSETTREAISKKKSFNLSFYNANKPAHIKKIDTSFLVWLIGFIEGDGSFLCRKTKTGGLQGNTIRGVFELTQSIDNIKLLKRIRTKVGFGTIREFERDGHRYCSWQTSKKENIIKLIHLLNGNLILTKRRKEFRRFLSILNKAWGLNIKLKTSKLTLKLNNSWFSGFCDADGGFFTNVLTNFKGSNKKNKGYYIKFLTRFYITQKDELPFLQEILKLTKASTKISQITNGKTQELYNRLEIFSSESTEILINYFSKFQLRGIRKIDSLRWARVHGYKNLRRVLTEKAALKLANLVLNLNEPLTDINLKNFSTNFSNSEITIFESCKLNRKHPDYQK